MNATAMVGRLEETSPKTKAGRVSGLLARTLGSLGSIICPTR
jgi:hypothetical protein